MKLLNSFYYLFMGSLIYILSFNIMDTIKDLPISIIFINVFLFVNVLMICIGFILYAFGLLNLFQNIETYIETYIETHIEKRSRFK